MNSERFLSVKAMKTETNPKTIPISKAITEKMSVNFVPIESPPVVKLEVSGEEHVTFDEL